MGAREGEREVDAPGRLVAAVRVGDRARFSVRAPPLPLAAWIVVAAVLLVTQTAAWQRWLAVQRPSWATPVDAGWGFILMPVAAVPILLLVLAWSRTRVSGEAGPGFVMLRWTIGPICWWRGSLSGEGISTYESWRGVRARVAFCTSAGKQLRFGLWRSDDARWLARFLGRVVRGDAEGTPQPTSTVPLEWHGHRVEGRSIGTVRRFLPRVTTIEGERAEVWEFRISVAGRIFLWVFLLLMLGLALALGSFAVPGYLHALVALPHRVSAPTTSIDDPVQLAGVVAVASVQVALALWCFAGIRYHRRLILFRDRVVLETLRNGRVDARDAVPLESLLRIMVTTHNFDRVVIVESTGRELAIPLQGGLWSEPAEHTFITSFRDALCRRLGRTRSIAIKDQRVDVDPATIEPS